MIDLKQLVDQLRGPRQIELPVLIRFGGVLKQRLAEIQAAFQAAISEQQYKGTLSVRLPNQGEPAAAGRGRGGAVRPGHRYGLEAGSKPELLAVVAMAGNDTPIICNGFKDDEFVEMALLAQKIGRQVFMVIEKYTELELILSMPQKIGVRPDDRRAGEAGRSGPRPLARLRADTAPSSASRSARCSARWRELKARGMEDCFRLLHFHLGSQITNIRQIKAALNEAARIYVDLVAHGAGLQYLDVGGGLGIDYDGSQTNFESSVNYTLQEYANDVVFHIQSVCDEAERAPSDDPFAKAAGPSSPITACWCSTCWARRSGRKQHAHANCPRAPSSRSGTCWKPTRIWRSATCWKPITMPSRHWTWRCNCSAAATCRWTSGARRRTCSGRSATRSAACCTRRRRVPGGAGRRSTPC